MRILFYLPVVTPWWFVSKITPMIRVLTAEHDVSIMVPPLWHETGIEAQHLLGLCDIDRVDWHILDGEDHPKLRTSAIDEEELFALVARIDPHFTLCRSADLETPARFPGIVRHIMEAAAPPFMLKEPIVWLSDTLFDHGLIPDLTPGQRGRLETSFAGPWRDLRGRFAGNRREAFLESAALPTDRKIIGLPLEYEHPELFFRIHDSHGSNIELLETLASQMTDDVQLAVTTHPLSELYCDNGPLLAAIDRLGDKVHLIQRTDPSVDVTMQLAQHADGMIVGNSKCFASAAFFGTPLLRLSRFRTGGWMHAHSEVAPFLNAIGTGTAREISEAVARLWFAFHFLNNVFEPTDATLTASDIVDRIVHPVNEARWDKALSYFLGDELWLAA